MKSPHLLLLALQLLFSRYVSFRVITFFSPAHPLLYIKDPAFRTSAEGIEHIDCGDLDLCQRLLIPSTNY